MTVQRLDFKAFDERLLTVSASGAKIFRASGSGNNAVEAPPPPTFSEDQLKEAERNGYKKGFLEGTAEGRKQAESEQSETDKKLVELVGGFTEKLSPIFDHYRAMALQLKKDMPQISAAIGHKIAGNALDQNAHDLILSTVTGCCETMIHEAKLTITVHETMADTLARRLQQLAERMPAATQIIIQRSPDMPLTDCKVEWEHGSMERSVEHIWKQVEKAIDNITEAHIRETELQLDMLRDIQNSPSAKE